MENDEISSKIINFDLFSQKYVNLGIKVDTKFASSKHSTFYFATEQIVNLLLWRFDKLGLIAQALLKRPQPKVLP